MLSTKLGDGDTREVLRSLDISCLGLPPEPQAQCETTGEAAQLTTRSESSYGAKECPICQEVMSVGTIVTDCSHQYHAACLAKWRDRCLSNDNHMTCAVCRQPLSACYKIISPRTLHRAEEWLDSGRSDDVPTYFVYERPPRGRFRSTSGVQDHLGTRAGRTAWLPPTREWHPEWIDMETWFVEYGTTPHRPSFGDELRHTRPRRPANYQPPEAGINVFGRAWATAINCACVPSRSARN